MDKLSLFTILIYLEENMFPTAFRTFAKTEQDAVHYVTIFVEQHVTDQYSIKEIKEDTIEEGKLFY